MDSKERLAHNIKEAYLKSGMSTRQIQRKSGLNFTTILRWINGKYVPNAITLKIFCDAVGATIAEIYEGV